MRNIVESYLLKKKKARDGDKLFQNKKSAQDKKNGKQFKHFFPFR